MKKLAIFLIITPTVMLGQLLHYNNFDTATAYFKIIILKTNYLGAPAMFIDNNDKMTVNDSLESIKSLLQIMYNKQKDIDDLSNKLEVAIAFIQNYNGMVVVEKDIHKYFLGLKKYYKGMGWDFVVHCKCQKCINHKAAKK